MRWFNTIVNQPNFKAVVGSVNLCEVASEGGAASGGGGGGKKKDQVIKTPFPLVINPLKTLIIFRFSRARRRRRRRPRRRRSPRRRSQRTTAGTPQCRQPQPRSVEVVYLSIFIDYGKNQ